MSKQCPSCGGNCGYTKTNGCNYGKKPKLKYGNSELLQSKLIAAIMATDGVTVVEAVGVLTIITNDLIEKARREVLNAN
jgi:hypothetical protein